MALRKRQTGWQVRVRPFPEVTLPTKTAAETVELDMKLRKKLGHLYQEKPITLGEELDGYVSRRIAMGGRRGPLRPKTIADLRLSTKGWDPLRDILISNLRRKLVEDCAAARAAVAPVSASHELELLKSALRAAASRGQTVDPGIFEIPAINTESEEGVALELEQVHDIASWMPERILRIVPFVGTAGLRFTEAVTLTDDRVDLAGAEIHIPRDLNKGRRVKAIKLARAEVQLLREQLLARPGGTSLVFPTSKGSIYTHSGFQSIWYPALYAAGFAHVDPDNPRDSEGRLRIVPDFKFHWLRHTAISLMARAGMKPELIAERVGHTDGGALIYRRYRHLFPSELRDAVGLLDELISASNIGSAEVVSGQ